MQILTRLKRIEKYMIPNNKQSTPVQSNANDVVGGINVSLLPAKDAYAYALILLDALFTKEELSKSLMFKTNKSSKPALDEERIRRIINLVEKRFPGKLDMKILKAKVNQKCRDSGVVKVKKEAIHEDIGVKEELKDRDFVTSLMEGSSSGTRRPIDTPLYRPFIDNSSDESDEDD